MKLTLKILSSLLLMFTTRGQTQLQLVKDIQPGDVSGLDGSPLPFLELNNDIYFKAWNKVGTYDNDALWRTDGTANGTVFISDEPGSGSSKPSSGMRFGDQLLFVANDGLTGQELWITDGTSAGTQFGCSSYDYTRRTNTKH